MKKLFAVLAALCFLAMTSCSGGGGGGNSNGSTTAKANLKILKALVNGTATAGSQISCNFTGSDTLGNTWNGSLTIVSDGTSIFENNNVTKSRTIWTFTSPAAYTITTTDYYWESDGDLYKEVDSSGVISLPSTQYPLPDNAMVGDTGSLGDITSSDGTSTSSTWKLEDASNGNYKFVVSTVNKNASNVIYGRSDETYYLDSTGNLYKYTGTVELSDRTVTMSGNITVIDPTTKESFTNGNITLNASVAISGSTKTVTVTESNGKTILTLNVTNSIATFTFPETSTPTVIDFQPPLSEVPTDYIAKRMAIFVAGPTYLISGTKGYKDNPGCDDWFNTQCTLSCCATHDVCYEKNGCTWESFFIEKSAECDDCNDKVIECMALACAKIINADNIHNNCYDHNCDKYYDCPPNYDTCGCKDICAETSTTTTTTSSTSTSVSMSSTSTSTSSYTTTSTSTSISTTSTTINSSNNYTSTHIGTLIYVPAGSFQTDSTSTDIQTVSAFRMSKYEITRAQFSTIMGVDPSDTSYSTGTNDPVQEVSFYDAVTFCNKLSIAEGLTPVYSVSGINFATLTYADIPTTDDYSWNKATANGSANGYRLPTRYEWMWAAMGATSGSGYTSGTYTTGYQKEFAGDPNPTTTGDSSLTYAWTDQNSNWETHPVGYKLPNELGLYDVSGNVWEWCQDYFWGCNYYSDGSNYCYSYYHYILGGGWNSDASKALVTYNNNYRINGNGNDCEAYEKVFDIGFRVVRN